MAGDKQAFADIDYEAWADAFRASTMDPFKVAHVFAANIAAAEHRALGCITSQMGSIASSGNATLLSRIEETVR